MNTPRLTAGTALVAVPGRGPALRTPDGTFLRVDTAGLPVEDLLRLFGGALPDRGPGGGRTAEQAYGGTDSAQVPGSGDDDGGTAARREGAPPSEGGAAARRGSAPPPGDGAHPATGGPARTDRLFAAFEEAGYATRSPAAPADPDTPLAGITVLLLGDPVLTRPVARLARELGAEPEPAAAGDLPGRAAPGGRTAVVWCLDGPVPAGLWDTADRLSRDGVPWARCHREGAVVWLEPPASGPYGVTAADVRLRRLAATPAHRELAAYWAGSRTPDNGPRHTAASAALTAALLVHDLAELLRRGPAHLPPVLRRTDLRDLTTTMHPVLPVPACAPLPEPADGGGTARAVDHGPGPRTEAARTVPGSAPRPGAAS
ncbi:hypothetical protein ACWDR0_24930 [Streptomyces sp. NPDC003691]